MKTSPYLIELLTGGKLWTLMVCTNQSYFNKSAHEFLSQRIWSESTNYRFTRE